VLHFKLDRDVHMQAFAEGLVQGHFRVLIVVFTQALRNAFEPATKPCKDIRHGAPVKFDEHDVTTGALNKEADRRTVYGALDEAPAQSPGTIWCGAAETTQPVLRTTASHDAHAQLRLALDVPGPGIQAHRIGRTVVALHSQRRQNRATPARHSFQK